MTLRGRGVTILASVLAGGLFIASALAVGWGSTYVEPVPLARSEGFEPAAVDTMDAMQRLVAFDHWGRASSVLVENEADERDTEVRMLGVETIGNDRSALLYLDPTTLAGIAGRQQLPSGLIRVVAGETIGPSIVVGPIGTDSMVLIVKDEPHELFLYPKDDP